MDATSRLAAGPAKLLVVLLLLQRLLRLKLLLLLLLHTPHLLRR